MHRDDQAVTELRLVMRDVQVQHLHELLREPEVGVGHIQLLVVEPPQLTVLVAGLEGGA